MASDFTKNAGLGAVTIIVTGFIPILQFFAPIVGGGVAGWRANFDRTSSTKLGAASGGLASLLFAPLLLIGGAVAVFDFGITFLTMLMFILPITAMLIGLGALGGYAGAALSESEPEDNITSSHGNKRRNLDTASDNDPDRIEELKHQYTSGDLTEEQLEAKLDQALNEPSESEEANQPQEMKERIENR